MSDPFVLPGKPREPYVEVVLSCELRVHRTKVGALELRQRVWPSALHEAFGDAWTGAVIENFQAQLQSAASQLAAMLLDRVVFDDPGEGEGISHE